MASGPSLQIAESPLVCLLYTSKILDVLRDSGRDAAPFSDTLPDFPAVRGGLFLFQQKVELVHVVARCLVLGAVDGNSVPHLILHDQHTSFSYKTRTHVYNSLPILYISVS